MKTLEFTYNWNNKLDCKCFTSIRLSDRYRVGEEFKIILINKKVPQVKGVARIIEIKEFYLHQLNTFIAALDTGYSVPECKKIIEYRGDKNLDISEYKLVLRSIDKLKEEEKDTIDNITMYDKELLELGTIVDYRHYSIAVMDYLRSINIDIDGFIDNGKAVKK